MDLPCDWAQFLYVCAERRPRRQRCHSDSDLVQGRTCDDTAVQYEPWTSRWRLVDEYPCLRVVSRNQKPLHQCLYRLEDIMESWVGLMHHVLVAIHESVLVLQKMYSDHKEAFSQAPKRQFGVIKLPTGEYVSPQYGPSKVHLLCITQPPSSRLVEPSGTG